ncbi:MAG TPA: hypothetical protein DCG12_23965, partial [Planctomycetaceae bacterium]|nr:hypothetical protein [Planctomycetaceae bacterium]
EANVPLKSAILRFSDDPTFATRAEEIVLRTEEKKIHGEFRMNLRVDQSFPKFYRIDVKDTDDRTDPDPTVYSVNVRPDKSPVVRLLDPIRDLSTPSNGIIPLLITAADPDFKLQAVELSYQINDDERIRREPVFDATREGLRQAWSGTWKFDLEPLNLQPGDQIAYYITARDNKPP